MAATTMRYQYNPYPTATTHRGSGNDVLDAVRAVGEAWRTHRQEQLARFALDPDGAWAEIQKSNRFRDRLLEDLRNGEV